jgi:hypothetical protein
MRALIIFATILLAACGAPPPATPLGTTYEVVVDPAAGADAYAQMQQAAAAWVAAIPELSLRVSQGPCPGVPARGVVCAAIADAAQQAEEHAAAGPGVIDDTVSWPPDDSAQVWFFSTEPGAQAAEHELGHAMGLVHTGPGTIMCAYTGGWPAGVTAADVTQFWALR